MWRPEGHTGCDPAGCVMCHVHGLTACAAAPPRHTTHTTPHRLPAGTRRSHPPTHLQHMDVAVALAVAVGGGSAGRRRSLLQRSGVAPYLACARRRRSRRRRSSSPSGRAPAPPRPAAAPAAAAGPAVVQHLGAAAPCRSGMSGRLPPLKPVRSGPVRSGPVRLVGARRRQQLAAAMGVEGRLQVGAWAAGRADVHVYTIRFASSGIESTGNNTRERRRHCCLPAARSTAVTPIGQSEESC